MLRQINNSSDDFAARLVLEGGTAHPAVKEALVQMNKATHAVRQRLALALVAGQQEALFPFRQQPGRGLAALRHGGFYLAALLLGSFYGFWGTVLPPAYIVILVVPALLLIGVLLWILPDERPASSRTSWLLFMAFTAVTFLWPNYLGLSLPGAPVLSLRRVVGLALMLAFLTRLASARRARERLLEMLSGFPLLWKLLVAFALVQMISILFADSWYLAYRFWFNALYAWIALFFVAVFVFAQPGRIEKWAQLIAGCAIFVAVIAIAEQFTKHVLWVDHIPAFLRVENDDVTRILTPTFRGAQYRSQAIFGVSLTLAEFLALAAPLAIHLLVIAKTARDRVLLAAGLAALIFGIAFTQARLGFIGLLTGGLLYLLLHGLIRLRTNRSDLIGPAISYGYAAGIIALYGLIMSVDALRVRIFGSGTAQSSNDARGIQFEMAPPVILQSPLFGHGPGRGAEALGFVTPGGLVTIDTYILSIVLDYGVIGFVLFYGMLAAALITSARLALAWRPTSGSANREASFILPLCAMLAAFLMIKTVLSQEENHAILFMIYGAIMVLTYRARGPQGRRPAHAPSGLSEN